MSVGLVRQVAVIIYLFACVAASWADGHYDVTYTTDMTWESTGWGGVYGGDHYDDAPYGFLEAEAGGVPLHTWGPTAPGYCETIGSITATFTWNNGGNGTVLPPDSVLVEETTQAYFSGETRSCDTDMPYESTYSSSDGGTCNGSGWVTVQNPGTSFTITSYQTAWGNEAYNNYGHCGTYFSTIPHNVRLAVTGTLANTKRILVGQTLHAKLSVDGVTLGSPSYAWSSNGEGLFKGFEEANDRTTGEYTKWLAADHTSDSEVDFHFAYATPFQQNTTVTATITSSSVNGHTVSPPFTATASATVTIEAPTVFFEILPATPGHPSVYRTTDTIGQMTLMNLTITGNPPVKTYTPTTTNPNSFFLWGAQKYDDQTKVFGIWLTRWVETSLDYYDTEGSGWWNYVQLATSKILEDGQGSSSSPHVAGDYDVRFLDFGDPYGGVDDKDTETHAPQSGSVKWAYFQDAPGLLFQTYTTPKKFVEAQYSDCYVVYKAPPNGLASQIRVSLQLTTWSCGGEADYDGTQWTIYAGSASGGTPRFKSLGTNYTWPADPVSLFPPATGEDTSSDHHFGWHVASPTS